jgi:MFS transporter, SP family, arabinose:H+ symporter
LTGAIGNSLTFWLFVLICTVAWMRVRVRVPETKGQSLEQIQQFWKVEA